MTVVLGAIVIAIIGLAVVITVGRGEPMSEAYDDRPDVRVRADRPLTGADLRSIRFTTALRGYDAAEVDALLDLLAAQLDDQG